MKPLSITLPRLIDQLVSREGVSLRIENPEKYHFDKNRLLSLLVQVVLLWSSEHQFVVFMIEENTLKLDMFKKVLRICTRNSLLDSTQLQKLQQFVSSIETQQGELNQLNQVVEDAPEEYCCFMTYELMNDPVKLPNSGVIVERANIEKSLMRSEMDPYDRTYLTKEMLIPCKDSFCECDIGDELREEIKKWKKEHNYPM